MNDNEYCTRNVDFYSKDGRDGVAKSLKWNFELDCNEQKVKGFVVSVPPQKIEVTFSDEDKTNIEEVTVDLDEVRVEFTMDLPLEPYQIWEEEKDFLIQF